METLLRQLVERLHKAHREDLVSVILYGSAAEPGQHHPGFSDINILCVLREITPRQLALSQPVFTWWRIHEGQQPLLLSEHEAATSTDCFPIEFHDMLRRHRVLYGRDVIDGLKVEDCFYRAQVEYELRVKLLRLRQRAASVMSDRKLLGRLLLESVSTFCVLLRHALLLHGFEIPSDRRAMLAVARERFTLDPAPFQQLLDVRENKMKIGQIHPETLLGSYLEELGKIIDAVDGLAKPMPAGTGGIA